MTVFNWFMRVSLWLARTCINIGFGINSVAYILLNFCASLLYEQEVNQRLREAKHGKH